MTKNFYFLLITFILFSINTFASVYYVSPAGTAGNSGLTQASPKSLTWAISNAVAGDIVYMRAGNYGGGTYVQNNNGTSTNPIQFIGTDMSWNPIVANNGCTFNTGDDVNGGTMPLLQEARVNSKGLGTAMKINGNYVHFKNFQIKYYERGLETIGDYNIIDNVFTLEQGNHYGPDNSDPFGAFYSGWGMTIRGEGPLVKNCLNVDAGAQGITFATTNNPRADYCYVSAYLGVNTGGTWDGNPNDYYFLLSSNTTNGLFTNITVHRATQNEHYGHGIVFKGNTGTISNNVVDGFTIYNTNLELQFPIVQNNLCKNGYIEKLTSINGSNPDVGGINLANGSSFNTFENIELVNNPIFFRDWNDGLSGDVADASDDNEFSQIIIRDSWVAISFNYWKNGYTTSAADRNTFNNLTIDNCNYLFSGNRANTATVVTNSIINDVNNLKVGPRGTSPGYAVNVTYTSSNFYGNGFTTPTGTNITTVDPQFTNIATNDFSLQSSSSLKGQGIATPFLAIGNDIGAIQGTGGGTPPVVITNDSIVLCKASSAYNYVIDGIEETLWDGVDTVFLSKTKTGVSAPIPSDLSANFKASWNDSGLYLFVKVIDDTIVSDGGIYIHDDGLSIYIDGGDENTNTYDANDYSLGFRYGTTDIYENNVLYSGTGIEKSEVLIPGGYAMEIKVSWSAIGITPSVANTIGLDVHVNDDDDGGNRDKKILWNDVSDSAYTDPSKLGTLTLTEDICFGLAKICKTTTPILIDALEDIVWTTIDSSSIASSVQGNLKPSTTDLSGNFKASWDNTSLYLLVKVMDDTLVSDGGVYIHNDGLSIYIDGGDENTTSYDANDHSLGFVFGTTDIYQNNVLYTGTGIEKSETLITGGYLMEIRIDWSLIGISPSGLNPIGLDIHINDDDDGGNRDQKIVWNDKTDLAYTNPSKVGTIELDTTACYNTTSTKTLTKMDVAIYPNPTKGDLTIKSDSPFNKVEVYNSLGVIVLNKETYPVVTKKINLISFPKGLYVIRFFMEDNIIDKRIIKK